MKVITICIRVLTYNDNDNKVKNHGYKTNWRRNSSVFEACNFKFTCSNDIRDISRNEHSTTDQNFPLVKYVVSTLPIFLQDEYFRVQMTVKSVPFL